MAVDSTIESRIRLLDDMLHRSLVCDDDDVHMALLAREGLLDSLLVLYEECSRRNLMKNEHVTAFIKKCGSTVAEVRRLRIQACDFEVKNVIGRGHFGEVQVVRDAHSETVYAMKTLRKQDILSQPDMSFYQEERDIMASARSPWLTHLHFAFQDSHVLYLIMEFHAGGDLLSQLARHDDVFPESTARFYLAEMVLAVNALHQMGYIHRDLKPENVLLDCKGHVKLADFGSAARLSKDQVVSSKRPVGTPDYISPELLEAVNSDHSHWYGLEVDWWAIGVCMYEMLFGKTPFTDESRCMMATYSNIMNYKACLQFPATTVISAVAEDLIRNLLVEKSKRLAYSEIKRHKFFTDIKWDRMRQETPPFVPQLQSLDDTSNFEEFEKIKHPHVFDDPRGECDFSGKDLPFIGFTYVEKMDTGAGGDKRLTRRSSVDLKTELNVDTALTTTCPSGSVDVTLTLKIEELKRLRDRCNRLESVECDLTSEKEKLSRTCREKDEEISTLALESEGYQRELENYVSKTNRLTKQLEAMIDDRSNMENEGERLINQINEIGSEARQVESELHQLKIEELQDVITQLGEEKLVLLRKIGQRDKQVTACREKLETSQKHGQQLQFKLDKERRKSRDDQKRDLVVLENREDMWRAQVDDKNAEILELKKRVTECEDLLEAYETQEKEYMEREQELRGRLNDNEGRDNLDIHVLVRAGTPSPKKDRKVSEKFKEMEDALRTQEQAREDWQKQEEQMKDKIEKLSSELEMKQHQHRLTAETKTSLTNQLHLYQQEIQEQRDRIKDLQESVKQCISESDDDKARKQSKLEVKVKELEVQLDCYHDDKRKLLSDVTKYQQECNDRQFKVTELERTASRQSCKMERLERQLSEAKEREMDLRLRRNQTTDLRIKLAEERVVDVQQEKIKLEAKMEKVTKELDELKSEQASTSDKAQTATAKTLKENLELKTKLDEVNRMVEKLEKQITRCERSISSLEKEIASKNTELHALRLTKDENSNLERKIRDLESEVAEKTETKKKLIEKEKEVTALERGKENMESKLMVLEKEMQELKSKRSSGLVGHGAGLGGRGSKFENVEDLKQEKKYLESRVATLQRQLDTADKKAVNLEKELADVKVSTDKLSVVEKEVVTLQQEKTTLQTRVHSLQEEMERKTRQHSDQNTDTQHAEQKLDQAREKYDKVLAEIRAELTESNLSLSEARSLVSATQRQAKAAGEVFEAEIRELKQRLFYLDKERGWKDDKLSSEKSEKQKVSADLANGMKAAKNENEMLMKNMKELEEKVASLQREKTAGLMEKHLLKDSLAQKDSQCQLEAQKCQKLREICGELELQIGDLEGIQKTHEAQQAEWNQAKLVYDRAMDEKEDDLEGTNQRLHALKQASQSSHEMAQMVKQQLQTAQTKHKQDLEGMKKQLADARKDVQKSAMRLLEMESHNGKLQNVVEQQTKLLEVDGTEKKRLKQEFSKLLSETQDIKSKNLKLQQNFDEAVDKLELIFGEKIDLENFTEALQGLHFLEKYRFEKTIGQQMKLIDYLQELWQDTVTKKKKGGKFFGKGKDGMASLPMLGDLQSALDQECKRTRHLQEQLDKLRSENFQQANELLKVRGTLREKLAGGGDTMVPHIKAAVQVMIRSPAGNQTCAAASAMLTPSTQRSMKALPPPSSCTQRMQHKIPHRFTMGLNTRATKCAVCLGSVHFVKQASKCQECSMVCHPRCESSAADSCGLPTEYVQHFTSMMERETRQSGRAHASSESEEDLVKMTGWLKIPKNRKQTGWERRWCMMEKDIFMLFHNDCDANPTDTFDLGPPETDVTVHSAVSPTELPSTTVIDLPYVLRLEHEPLTTCWPGRVLYLMAADFSEKQRWVACLEVAIKKLRKVDKTKRCKIQVTQLMEMSGDRRLELNCSLLLSKQLTLLGADEGLYAVNIHREPPVLTKLNQFSSIHLLKYIPQLNLIIAISGKNRSVLVIDKKLIQLRLGQSNGETTQNVYHTPVEGVVGCTVLDVGTTAGDAGVYMCVGLTDKVLLLKYNTDLKQFCVRKELSTYEPCSCVCMTDTFAIVGTDKFYRINLDHPSLTDFVDKKDSTLAFAAFGAANHHSYPLAVVQVSPDGLPLEFLLCFHEFGVYVDNKGQRSRPGAMKWSCLPLSFAYREPFLYVTYFNSVQAITVPAYKDNVRGKQTSADLTCPRFLGSALEPGTVLVASSSGVSTELLNLRGNDGTVIERIGKENRKGIRAASSASKADTSQRFTSPMKPSNFSSSKYRSSRRCNPVSTSSVSSGSSISSSSSTVSSYSDSASVISDI